MWLPSSLFSHSHHLHPQKPLHWEEWSNGEEFATAGESDDGVVEGNGAVADADYDLLDEGLDLLVAAASDECLMMVR